MTLRRLNGAPLSSKTWSDAVRPEDIGIARDFAQSVRAQVAWQAGRTADALAELEKAQMATTYELMIGSPFYSHAGERYVLAEMFYELGRDQEALPWYRSFEEPTLYDLIYLALHTSGAVRSTSGWARRREPASTTPGSSSFGKTAIRS